MSNDDFALQLGTRIRELRKLKGVSQLELAYDMDMSMNTISGIELGKISPKIDTLKKIAQKLEIDIAELFEFVPYSHKDKVIRKQVEEISRKIAGYDKDFLSLISEAIELLVKARNKA